MAKLGTWSTTAGNNNSTPPDGWPEGQAPSTVNDCAREMMAQIRTVFNDAQFVDQGFTPTYVSATTFTVTGDQTSAIHAGRRLKIFDATAGVATTIYATVTTASFTTVTTIQISADAGQLTSSLSSFAIAILSNTNPSLPRALGANSLSAETLFVGSTLTVSGATVLKGALSLGGALAAGSTLGVTGAVSFASTLAVTGVLTTNDNLIIGNGVASSAVALEIGNGRTGTGSSSIDFHGTSATDYDVRLSCANGGAGAGQGTLEILAGSVALDGRLSVSGTVVAQNIAKAWARFVLTAGGVTIQASFNVASASRSATGVCRVNLTTALADTNYAVDINPMTINPPLLGAQSLSLTASSVKFTIATVDNTAVDAVNVSMFLYR